MTKQKFMDLLKEELSDIEKALDDFGLGPEEEIALGAKWDEVNKMITILEGSE